MKQKILLVGDYNRSDFIYIAKELNNKVEFFFIEYLNKKHLTNKECLTYGEVLYWKNYESAYDLIEKIKPSKVVFYFIETYNHVALNVACKVKKVPTFHLEHGLRFPVSFYKMINAASSNSNKNKSMLTFFSKLSDLGDKYKSRKFFQNTVALSPKPESTFLKEFYAVRSQNTIFDTFQKLKSPLRLPDAYISFSPMIFKYHKEMEELPEGFPVQYTGIPSFDKFFPGKEIMNTGENMLFIDQPFAENFFFGWTPEYRSWFLNKLADCASSLQKKMYIKPHPWNEKNSYNKIASSKDILIVNDGLEEMIPDVNTVLGFSSTLLLPFMAMNHICCFTMEMHPAPGKILQSQFFLEAGPCNAVDSFYDLTLKLGERDKWHAQQKKFKEQFIQNWMYKFDGKSTERLRNILLNENS